MDYEQLLYEVSEGYREEDEIAEEAAKRLALLTRNRGKDLAEAGAVYRSLNREASGIREIYAWKSRARPRSGS